MKSEKNPQDKEIWVFLSHSNEDYEKVRRVRNMLEEQNLRPIMFFLKCLNDDDEIDGLIKREIDCRTRFILCDSENARNSRWVQREIEYIERQQKPYERIDLSKSDAEIFAQLKEVRRKSKLFIAYSSRERKLASYVYTRLSKYDYDVFIDFDRLLPGELYARRIMTEIEGAVENGYIIALFSEAGHDFQLVDKEVALARKYDREHGIKGGSVIPVVIDSGIPYICADLNCIQFKKRTEDLPDRIVNAILKRLLAPGEILTYYRNFKNGINSDVDLFESEQLGRLYRDICSE